MTLQVAFFLILGGWAVAAVLGLIQLAFDALAADARGARLPARSLLQSLRNPIRLGVLCTSVVVFALIFETINETWHLSFKLFFHSGSVKRFVFVAGVWIGSMIVMSYFDRLLDRLLPHDPANRTPTTEIDKNSAWPAS
jgi:hypothetical protein